MNRLHLAGFWLVACALVWCSASRSAGAQQGSGGGQSAAKPNYPSDIYPDSRARIPLPKREDFSAEEEKKAFDRIVSRDNSVPTNATGIRLHMPIMAEYYRLANNWLRDHGGLEPRYEELAILVASRESNGANEWIGHERSGLQAGLSQEIIDIIKHKKDTKGLAEKDEVIIRLGREMHREPKVTSKTYADMERLFGRRATLAIASLIVHYSASAMLLRVYDVQLRPDEKPPFPSH